MRSKPEVPRAFQNPALRARAAPASDDGDTRPPHPRVQAAVADLALPVALNVGVDDGGALLVADCAAFLVDAVVEVEV